MRTRFLRGTRDQNNGLTLAEGELSIDEETKAVRLHDGQTLGGFEMVGTQAIELPPGPMLLKSGNDQLGWYGEVAATELIDGTTLASNIGLSEGTAFNDTSPWLKFSYESKTLYVSKLPLRYALTWESINVLGASSGELTVTIGEHSYIVRLLAGNDSSPNEWEDLLYPLEENHYGGSAVWESWTATDFGLGTTVGRFSWIAGAWSTDPSRRVLRGGSSILGTTYSETPTSAATSRGWRPVLELVE